jgi:hypothetical protein
MTKRLAFFAANALLLATFPAAAADKSTPDWPCIQKKVENIAASQVWSGPSLDEAKGWQDDEAVAALVRRLTTRRYAIPEAIEAAKKFADEQPEAERDRRLTKVFAGVFETLSAERRTIMAGIEKYNKRQKERATVIEDKGKAIAELEAKGVTDEAAMAELAKLQEDYDWEQRVFKERNDNVPIACELPVLIDQRLFELGQALHGMMKAQ